MFFEQRKREGQRPPLRLPGTFQDIKEIVSLTEL